MANKDAIYGLRPVDALGSASADFRVGRYFIPATDTTAVFVGDLVKLAGSADTDGVPTVTQAATGNAMVGAVVSVEPTTRESKVYREASTARYVLVADDPNQIFAVQEDSVGGAMAAADVGLNAEITVGSGSTVTGLSGVELDSSTKATTTTHDLGIIGLLRKVDNEIGTNAEWLVRINNHQYTKNATGV